MPPAIAHGLALLSADSQDGASHCRIRLWGRSPELGPAELVCEYLAPAQILVMSTVRLPDKVPPPLHREKAPYSTFQGQPLDILIYAGPAEAAAAARALREARIETIQAEFKPHEQLFMELGLPGACAVQGQARWRSGRAVFTNPALAPATVSTTLRCASIDIENGVTLDKLFSIALHVRGAGLERRQVFMLADAFGSLDDGFTLTYPSEADLLLAFMESFRLEDPDLVIGWNLVGYDLRMLEYYCKRNYLDLALGRDGSNAVITEATSGAVFASIAGRAIADGGMNLMLDLGHRLARYNLETVARSILGEGKLIHDENADKVAEIERQFREDKPSLARYNLQDTELVSRLFERLEVVPFLLARSRACRLPVSMLGLPGAALDQLLGASCLAAGRLCPPLPQAARGSAAASGFHLSRDGVHRHVAEFALSSFSAALVAGFGLCPLAMDAGGEVELPGGGRLNPAKAVLAPRLRHLLHEATSLNGGARSGLLLGASQLAEAALSPASRFHTQAFAAAYAACAQRLGAILQHVLERLGALPLAYDEDRLFCPFPTDRDPQELADALNQALGAELGQPGLQLYSFVRRHSALLLLSRKDDRNLRFCVPDPEEPAQLLQQGLYYAPNRHAPLCQHFQRGLYAALLQGRSASDFTKDYVESFRRAPDLQLLAYRRRLNPATDKPDQPHAIAAAKLPSPPREIRYILSRAQGPVPLEFMPADPDVDAYIKHDIEVAAQPALDLEGKKFSQLFQAEQLRLF